MSTSPPPTRPPVGQSAGIPEMPAIWPGYLAALLFLVVEVWEIAKEVDLAEPIHSPFDPLLSLISFGGWAYWLYCVYRYHEAIAQVPGYEHAITPGRAAWLHFLPFYNIYWVFKWPTEMAVFVNWRTQSQVMKGWVPGLFVLTGVLVLRLVDGAVGLAIVFTAGIYVSRRLVMAFSMVPATAPPVRRPAGL